MTNLIKVKGITYQIKLTNGKTRRCNSTVTSDTDVTKFLNDRLKNKLIVSAKLISVTE